jgi:hypothetical protein
MSHSSSSDTELLLSARAAASNLSFQRYGTLYCMGLPMFRATSARDYGCLLDVDADVVSWSCLPFTLRHHEHFQVPDLLVRRRLGDELINVIADESPPSPQWAADAAAKRGYTFRDVREHELRTSFRLSNAQDLLQYANWRPRLGDKLRLLSALDEHCSLTVAECLSLFREMPAMAGLASMILWRIVEVDLDSESIHPKTIVKRQPG